MSDHAAIRQLKKTLRGRLIQPGRSGYDEARAIWNGRIDRRPAAIVRCMGVADVMAAVAFARSQGMVLSVRGGGHHTAGHAVCDDGLMVDLSPLNGIRVDPVARTARVGPGARVSDLDHEAQAFGLMTTGAPVSMVGMSGYTLGGGLGWTSRKHGLACDNLISADVVTAEGKLVHADELENTDLFWALRGGSGNFGIVTSFQFQLHALGPQVLAGPVVHPMEAAPELLRFWRDFMLEAPDALQCMPLVFQTPQEETVFALFPLYAGDPAEGEEVMAPLREAGNPSSDGVARVGYAGLLSDLDEMYRAGDRVYYRSAFFDRFPDAAMDILAEKAAPVPSPLSSLFLEPMGGAIARRGGSATAFPHRERAFCLTAVPKWEDPARDAEMEAWADDLFDALAPYAAEGVYVNYLNDLGEDQTRAAYGEHWDRLVEVKKRWDPENVFRMNHNVSPAG